MAATILHSTPVTSKTCYADVASINVRFAPATGSIKPYELYAVLKDGTNARTSASYKTEASAIKAARKWADYIIDRN